MLRLLTTIAVTVATTFVPVTVSLAAQPAANEKMPPLRPPATPLVTVDPYFSIWSNSDRLTDADTKHWTGKPHTLIGLVRVDGKPFRVMGAEPKSVPAMEQASLKVTPTKTTYTFTGGGVQIKLSFLTPMLPDDLDVLTRPATYVTWSATSTDGKPHEVSAMLAAGADLCVNTPDQPVVARREKIGEMTALVIGSESQPILRSKGDDHRIDWGFLYVTAPDAAGHAIGAANTLTKTFSDSGKLPAKDDTRFPRPVKEGLPSAAVVVDLGKVTGGADKPAEKHAILAYDDLYSIQFMKKNLRPYWRRGGMDAAAMIQAAEKDHSALVERCARFDEELTADARKFGGEAYGRLCSLAHRQSLAAQKIVADGNGMPLSFSKENFSNGCIATVDVFYPQLPHFLLMNPTLAKAALVPLLEYSRTDRWKFDFAPHDLGTYPQANGQVYGGGERTEDNQMPVEECGNMLILMAAVARVDGNADFAQKYWPVLTKWAKYLEAKGFDPENQLCTDDFAGHLAHNTNLSIKAIMGLASYAHLADLRDEKDEATRVRAVARGFADRWVKEAAEDDHFKLTFDKPGTWSQKYNLVWDKLLGFNLFPKEVGEKEIAFYLTKQNRFGLPLDSRSSYTKLDWILWTATIASNQRDFQALVDPLAVWLNETPSRVPMTDWYFTDSGKQSGFQARPVVGGLFIKFLSDEATWKKYAGRAGKPDATKNEWADMPTPPQVVVIDPGAKDAPVEYRYTMEKQSNDNWSKKDFPGESKWKKGPGGFGTEGTPGAVVRTKWSTPDIFLRRELTIPDGTDLKSLQLYVHHDEDARIFINGVLAAHLRGFTGDYDVVEILPAAAATLKPGKNTLAVHCHQTTGGQYIDVGLARLKR